MKVVEARQLPEWGTSIFQTGRGCEWIHRILWKVVDWLWWDIWNLLHLEFAESGECKQICDFCFWLFNNSFIAWFPWSPRVWKWLTRLTCQSVWKSVSQSVSQKSIVFLSKTRNFASPRASPGVKTFQSSKTLHTESQKTRSNELSCEILEVRNWIPENLDSSRRLLKIMTESANQWQE